MIAIDRILDAIQNGEWHAIKEVAQKTRVTESKVEIISGFLVTYDFLEFDQRSRKIRLSPQLQRFLRKIQQVENEDTIGRKNTPAPNLLS